MYQIEQLEELIKAYLGSDRELLSYSAKNLTAPGENYGSLMLSVEIKVKNKNTNQEESMYAVAKTPPPNEFSQKLFNTKVTFKTEIEFYRTIFPTLQNFQKAHGLKPSVYFPDFIAARLNLDDNDEVDANAILVLENLAVKKFITENRYQGFNLETTKLILRDLANLHATAIAFKLENPEEFKQKILPYLDGVVFEGDSQEKGLLNNAIKDCSSMLKENAKLSRFEPNVIKMLENATLRDIREPFATIVHADLWVNNTMVKYYNNSKILDNKFVDFQVCRYQTPADDLLFFLFTSVQDDIINDNLNDLIQFYFKEFTTTLEKLKCDTAPFSWEAFEEEMMYAKTVQFMHCVCMLYPIFMEKSKAKDLKDLGKDFVFEVSARQKEKFFFIVKHFAKKGWLD